MLIEILLNLNLTSGSSKILLYLQFQINEFNNIFYLLYFLSCKIYKKS